MPVLEISSSQHPVKAGLSDAFMILNPSPDVPGESLGIQRSSRTGWGGGWTEFQLTQAVGGWGWAVEGVDGGQRAKQEGGKMVHNEFQLFFIKAEEPFVSPSEISHGRRGSSFGGEEEPLNTPSL